MHPREFFSLVHAGLRTPLKYSGAHARAPDRSIRRTPRKRPPTFADQFGPSRAVNGEALAGYFAETFIHERVLTIKADGYETLRFPLLPELGATNTYKLKRKK